jgi:hypothetical protein
LVLSLAAVIDAVTLYKIQSDGCVEVTLDNEDEEYLQNFAMEGLRVGSCSEKGYAVKDSTQMMAAPFLQKPVMLTYMRQSALEVFALKAKAWLTAPFMVQQLSPRTSSSPRTAPSRPATLSIGAEKFSLRNGMQGKSKNLNQGSEVYEEGLWDKTAAEGTLNVATYGKLEEGVCSKDRQHNGKQQQIPYYCCQPEHSQEFQTWFCDAWSECDDASWNFFLEGIKHRLFKAQTGRCRSIERYMDAAYGKALGDMEREMALQIVKDFKQSPAEDVIAGCMRSNIRKACTTHIPALPQIKGETSARAGTKNHKPWSYDHDRMEVDPEYPGTSLERLRNIHMRLSSLKHSDLSGDWEEVRMKLLWAGGMRSLPRSGTSAETSFAFNDDDHCDMTPMLGLTVNGHSSMLGLGQIKRGSMEELGPGGSWVTRGRGCKLEPPEDSAHNIYKSRIAFKLVWCPPTFSSFVLVDDNGSLLQSGMPTGEELPALSLREANYKLVEGSKYAIEADKFVHMRADSKEDVRNNMIPLAGASRATERQMVPALSFFSKDEVRP